jgi:predicted restriction endonuclease
VSINRWTKEQLKLAFQLYCQVPFGTLHRGNREIIALAELIGRTPSAVSLKLVNLASLDPAIRDSGRSGMTNVSKLDREIWDEFHADWEGLNMECTRLRQKMSASSGATLTPMDDVDSLDDFTGETRSAQIEQRINQRFFRRVILASYRGRCCITGLGVPSLLVASHIVPWSKDKANRLNPSNGICLSALHDRAFDKGLITFDNEWRVILSTELKERQELPVDVAFKSVEGQRIEFPERFTPNSVFMEWHRENIFLS